MKYLSALLLIGATLHGSDRALVKINKRPLANLNEAPAYYAELAAQLDSQEPDENDLNRKFLPLRSTLDGHVCGDMSFAGIQIGALSWKIYLVNNEDEWGIKLANPQTCSIDDLLATYFVVIHDLKNGWQTRSDDSMIVFTKSTEGKLYQISLIASFAKKFNLNHKVKCYALGEQCYSSQQSKGTICLTIARDAIREFNNKFWDTGIQESLKLDN